MKNIFLTIAILAACGDADAQTGTTGGSQMVSMPLSNVIEISFTGTNSMLGTPISLSFDDPSDFINGIESTPQQLRVRTNKAFNVNVKSSTSTFNYVGLLDTGNQPTLDVANTLSIAIESNNTGGQTAQPQNKYFGITSSAQNLITHGGVGNNQNYSVKYKAKPGEQIPDGTYAVDLIYTASQE